MDIGSIASSVVDFLSDKDAHHNQKALDKKARKQEEIHTFGIFGKRFIVVKKENLNFLKGLFYNFLTYFNIIKTDEDSVEKLKSATVRHVKKEEFRKWAKENGKKTKSEILALEKANESLVEKIKEEKSRGDAYKQRKNEYREFVTSRDERRSFLNQYPNRVDRQK